MYVHNTEMQCNNADQATSAIWTEIFYILCKLEYDVVKQQLQTTSLNNSSQQSYGSNGPTASSFPTHIFSSYLQLFPFIADSHKSERKAYKRGFILSSSDLLVYAYRNIM